MKKVVLIMVLFLLNTSDIKATEKLVVTLDKCVDGDTAYFNLNNEKIKTRFLAIDTPESTNKIEAYGKEASDFTCNKLKNAKKIEIEYDDNSDKFDKYDRHLVWIFVDDELLQNIIIKKGLAKVAYLYGDYKYTSILEDSEKLAQQMKLNIWSDYKKTEPNYYFIILMIIIIIIAFIFSKKYRKKMINSAKSKLKSTMKNEIKKQFKLK